MRSCATWCVDPCIEGPHSEVRPTDAAAIVVDVVVKGAMQGGEFLQTLHPAKAKHRLFPSSESPMRIHHPVVEPVADLAHGDGAQGLECSAI
jgi:hypothetical protein